MQIHNLGFPRIGAKRELKFNLEKFWRGDIERSEFLNECQRIRKNNWLVQQQEGIDYLTVGDFAHYDHVLNTSLLLGVAPQRFNHESDKLTQEFAIARGQQSTCCSAASDMTKWFNTNYHYLVPELTVGQELELDTGRLLAQITEARHLSEKIKVVLLGPITYLYLSTIDSGNEQDKLALVSKFISAYQAIIAELDEQNVEWVQIDEPILGLELSEPWQQALLDCYQNLKTTNSQIKLLLTTYFASVDHHLEIIKQFNLDGLHIDTVAEVTNAGKFAKELPDHWVLSLGVINGRNIWKADLVALYQKVLPIYRQLGERLWLAPSCSLLHVPVDLAQEQKLDGEIKSWLSFAKQKCSELSLLRQALVDEDTDKITQYSSATLSRLVAKRCKIDSVQQRVSTLQPEDFHRDTVFEQRKKAQQDVLNLPKLPTTTIGSFPQTGDIRQIRADWRKGELSDDAYQALIRQEIKATIEKQEALDLDVLVHGEAERNDMVEYFGELLEGVAFTQYAWVQSYGSRCVKPPIIFGDIERKQAMTVDWISYAQSLTDKQVKAMLTGPITILAWSFVRDDIEREQVAKQIGLAISDEVDDLIQAGIEIIQIDEPAIREAMPLKQSQWQRYLDWATASFRLSSAKAPAPIQIHSHMCYSEFNDILAAIIDLDADVLTIETSRSNMAILDAFTEQAYPNDLGPGVYDIHSPNIPNIDWIVDLLKKAAEFIPYDRLWVNPDCGLKTRQWPETEAALKNMVQATKQLRAELL